MMSIETTENDYDKPLPRLRGLTAEWYGWLKQHELRFQQCDRCKVWRHVPREVCPGCGGTDWSWNPSSGRGKIYSWTTIYRSLHPSFPETPYAAVVVELEEGPRVMTRIVDKGPDDLVMDMPVEVVFEDVTPEVTLAKFKSAG